MSFRHVRDWTGHSADPHDEQFGDIIEQTSLESADEYDAVIVGEPYDGGVIGRAGAREGPAAIREALARTKTHHFDAGPVESVADLGNIEIPGGESVSAVQQAVREVAESIHDTDTVPVFLGGDNSLTYANVVPLFGHRADGGYMTDGGFGKDDESVGDVEHFDPTGGSDEGEDDDSDETEGVDEADEDADKAEEDDSEPLEEEPADLEDDPDEADVDEPTEETDEGNGDDTEETTDSEEDESEDREADQDEEEQEADGDEEDDTEEADGDEEDDTGEAEEETDEADGKGSEKSEEDDSQATEEEQEDDAEEDDSEDATEDESTEETDSGVGTAETVEMTSSVTETTESETTADHVGVISLDAHLDFRDVEGQPTSGTPYRQLLDAGLDSLAVVGARHFETTTAYAEQLQERGGSIITAEEVGDDPVEAANRALETVADADAVYVSVDMDVLDSAAGPGVSAPTPGGITSRELFRIVRLLASDDRLAGIEIVETAPPLCPDGRTARVAARTVAHALSVQE